MDDFVISNLNESRNEWCARLISIFTPLIKEGVQSIFNEAWKLCTDTDELNKYLMTFQNILSRIPKWNSIIVEEEKKRIVKRSGCNYLEDLITCVHIIQLKVLTCIRVGNKQKKIDISIQKLDSFIHKVYIHVARKAYMNVYLFEGADRRHACVAGHQSGHGTGSDHCDHRRKRVRQVDDRAGDHGAVAAGGKAAGANPAGWHGHSANARTRPVQDARQCDGHGVSGTDDRAEPRADHRRTGRRNDQCP